mgnify:CR=1 FL=1
MNTKSNLFTTTLLVAGLVIGGLILLNGCKNSEHEHAATTTEPAKEAASAAIEQTICPVMEMKIDKNVFVEYKGKKVYFCCPDCIDKFKAEPEKYAAKLPQIQAKPSMMNPQGQDAPASQHQH